LIRRRLVQSPRLPEGGGTPRKSDRDAALVDDLRRLDEPDTLGDPVRPRLWVSKSLEKLSSALADMGHSVSPNTVRMLLVTNLGFSRQSNRKADEGTNHPDRNVQFEYINAQVLAARTAGEPVICVDTKRKELVGSHRNAGSDWRPKGDPPRECTRLSNKEVGKVASYSVYDITANAGRSAWAPHTIRPLSWWHAFAPQQDRHRTHRLPILIAEEVQEHR
jgi:hypothetical protein